MLMLQHSSARVFRLKGAFSHPRVADRSILAGSRHSNSIAKTVVYRALHKHASAVPAALPRAWFDDISVRVKGSRHMVMRTMVKSTNSLFFALKDEGLVLADKTVMFATSAQDTKIMVKRIRQAFKLDCAPAEEVAC